MLQATLSPLTTTRTSTTTPTTTTTKTSTSTISPLLFTIDTKLVQMPTAPASVDTAFACSNNVCYAMGDVDFLFRTLQGLINNGNRKLRTMNVTAGADIVVDGRIDARTLNAYLPISRTVGGTLAIFDFTPDPKYLASNARNIALGIATWLGLTWVPDAPGVPGHWERMRAGQTAQLPPPPPKVEEGKTLAPTTSTPTPAPTPQPTPTVQPAPQSAPQPVMTMFVCPDGSRAASMDACPKTAVSTPTPAAAPPVVQEGPRVASMMPPAQPSPVVFEPSPTEGRFRGCIARFNRTRKVYAIYCPIGSEGATPGLGVYDGEYFRCLSANCTGLGADTVTPPVPTGFVKSVEVTTLPRAGETQAGDERDKFFRLGNPLMWAAIAGTAAVVGGGGYMLYRRKRAA